MRAEKLYAELSTLVNDSLRRHEKVAKVYKNKELKQAGLLDYIFDINKQQTLKKNTVRTVLALDATYSMGSVLNKVVNILMETFERTNTIL